MSAGNKKDGDLPATERGLAKFLHLAIRFPNSNDGYRLDLFRIRKWKCAVPSAVKFEKLFKVDARQLIDEFGTLPISELIPERQDVVLPETA